MKHDWKYIKLGDIISPAKVVRNGANKKFPVLSITMRDGIVFQSSRFKKSIASVDTSDYKVVYNGQLVIAFPIDEGLIYTQDIVDAGIMSPAYNVWNVDFLEIDRKFLVLYLHCPFSMAYYKSKLRGTTMRRRSMPKEDLLNMPLPVPSFSVQQSIISELDKINELIRLKKEQLKDYDNLAQSIFYEMFGDPVVNEKGWEVKKLGEVSMIKTGPFGSMLHKEDYITGGIPLINPMHIQNFKAVPDKDFTISMEKAAELCNYQLKINDVIFARRGDIGRCAVISDKEAGYLCGTGSLFVRFERKLSSIYTMYVVRTTSFIKELVSKAKGATMLNLNSSTMENLRFPIPPLPLPQLFAQRIELIEKQTAEVQRTIADLETLLASRMQYWFD